MSHPSYEHRLKECLPGQVYSSFIRGTDKKLAKKASKNIFKLSTAPPTYGEFFKVFEVLLTTESTWKINKLNPKFLHDLLF